MRLPAPPCCHDQRGFSGDVFSNMPRYRPRVRVVATAGGKADRNTNRFTLVEIICMALQTFPVINNTALRGPEILVAFSSILLHEVIGCYGSVRCVLRSAK